MYILKSIPKPRVWGTSRLQSYSTEQMDGKIGSVYTASGIAEIDSPIASGKETLRKVILQKPEKFGLVKGEEFPLIISMTAADEDLSIQVHPTDTYAREVENKLYGKSEAWFFLSEPKSGSIIAGQTAESEVVFRQAVADGRYQQILARETIAVNDMAYIPSGTIHALTKGSLVYEIQQSTDITYRFYDYDRLDVTGEKRELHTKKALETVDYQQTISKSPFALEQTLDVREFKVKRTVIHGTYTNEESIVQVLTLLRGNTCINHKMVMKGQSVLVLPDEQITVEHSAECMIATPKTYWRDKF